MECAAFDLGVVSSRVECRDDLKINLWWGGEEWALQIEAHWTNVLRHSRQPRLLVVLTFPFPPASLDDGTFLAGATDPSAVPVCTVPNKEEPGSQGDQD